MFDLKTEQNYNAIFEIIRYELNKLDPLGIVSLNSHLLDEYDTENKEILPLIKNYKDYKAFANIICEVFKNSTNLDFNPEMFYTCAKNILSKSQNYK